MPTPLPTTQLIKDMPVTERPRERLRDYGPGALSTAELLAIILRTGTKGRTCSTWPRI